MWDLRLNAMRAFAAVYSCGGIRAAARELGIAHSSVSRHVTELEASLGVALTRSSAGARGLEFTPQGEALGKAALNGFRDMAQVVSSLREARSASSVLIAAPSSFAVRWLLPRLPEFERLHPHTEVSVVVQRLEDLASAGVDIAIRMGSSPRPGVQCEPLMGDALYPVMSPSLWENAGRPSTPEDLVGLRLLHDRDPEASWDAWRRVHGPDRLDVRKGSRLTSSDLVLRAAIQGQGVALARHQLAVEDLASGVLVRPIDALCVELEFAYWMVLPTHMAPRPATMQVIAWLKRQAKATPTPSIPQ